MYFAVITERRLTGFAILIFVRGETFQFAPVVGHLSISLSLSRLPPSCSWDLLLLTKNRDFESCGILSSHHNSNMRHHPALIRRCLQPRAGRARAHRRSWRRISMGLHHRLAWFEFAFLALLLNLSVILLCLSSYQLIFFSFFHPINKLLLFS